MRDHKDGVHGCLKRPEFMRNKVRGAAAPLNADSKISGHVKMLSESIGLIDGLAVGKTLDSINMGYSFSPLNGKEIKTERTKSTIKDEVKQGNFEEDQNENKVFMMQEAINNISF